MGLMFNAQDSIVLCRTSKLFRNCMQSPQQRVIPEPKDTLGKTLYALRLNGLVYASSELSAPWGMAMPPMPGKIMFHIVTQGHCCLSLSNGDSIALNAGDLVLLPKGEGHNISSAQSVHCEPFFNIEVDKVSDRFELLRYGAGGEETLLTCGVLSFDQVVGQKLIAQLPAVIHIQKQNGAFSNQIVTLIDLMAEEARALSPGGETVIAHLADIIVIKAIRHWIEHSPDTSKGWLGGLQDAKISKALAAIHAHPEFTWTVELLADQAGMSRSGFSARFTELIGTSVKQYLTEWRMNLARVKIMESSTPPPLVALAEELGYTSEASFSRAYKRIFGTAPIRHKQTDTTP